MTEYTNWMSPWDWNIMRKRYTVYTCLIDSCLTHWGRVTHIRVSELIIIGSDNGLSPGRRQAIIWNNAGLLLIEPLGANVSEISVGIQIFSFKKNALEHVVCETAAILSRPQCVKF